MHLKTLTLVGILGVALALVGCSGKASIERATRSQAFAAAEPEVKAMWITAMAALKTNDYVVPQCILFDLRARTNLTTEQHALAEDTLTTVRGRLVKAAGQGDAVALKALEAVRELRTARKLGS